MLIGGMGMKRWRPHILVLCILTIVLLTGTHKVLQNLLADKRFGWFPRQATGAIVLVAIDSPSIQKIGVWPWPRQKHAELIDKLESAGVSDIVFDVDFSSPSTPASDQSFVEALQRAGGSVVLPAFKQWAADREKGKTLHINRPLPQFDKHAWAAIVNVAVEPDGLVRRYSFGEVLDGMFLPSAGALLAGKLETREEPLRIDYSIRTESLPIVSYVDVLRGDSATVQKLKGKKVIVGATAIELGDRFSVPNGRVISGSELQMLAADSIVQGRALRVASGAVTLGGLGFILLLMVALWRRSSPGLRVVCLIGVAVLAESSAVLLQATFPVIVDTSLWHVAIVCYLAAMALDEIDFRSLLRGVAERRFERIAMSLGDGLVCAGQDNLITVWNPGAVAIFGYLPEEMIGQSFDKICAGSDVTGQRVTFSLLELPLEELQVPGGKIMELEGRRKNGETFPLEACFSEWQGVDGFQYGAVMRDISARKREAERMRYLAEHDTLTDLANRHILYEQLAARLAEATTAQNKVALLILDLDKFKQINDTLGHACGDQLLCEVAKRMSDLVDGTSLVARLSGDEFAVVLSGADAVDRAQQLAEQTCLAFNKIPFSIDNRQIRVNASIGVAVYPEYCTTADELFANADLALYRAKAAGRGRHVVFERRMREEFEARLSLEAELAQAVQQNQFELFYQPQVRLKDGKLVGAEALIRWRHPARGLVPPVEFMPLINASAMSDRIALWVMKTACRQGRLWQLVGHDIRLGVNLAPSQLQSGNLAATVEEVLNDTGFSPGLLELEVTENILLEDDDKALETFSRIRNLGVRIAFDDFGTGYGSLIYLKKFPLDRLKIDRSFVRELRVDSDDAAIVGSTISLGKLLGLSVIAEGIEDAARADLLASMGCEEGQGYHFGRPMPAMEFEKHFLLQDDRHSGSSVTEPAATAA